jgi:hypothetical protein
MSSFAILNKFIFRKINLFQIKCLVGNLSDSTLHRMLRFFFFQVYKYSSRACQKIFQMELAP